MAVPVDDAVRQPGMPRGLVVILALAGLLVSMLALPQFSGVVAPVLLALVLTIAMHPLTGRFVRWGLPKWLATTLTLLATFAIIIALAVSIAYAIARLGTLLPRYEHRFAGLLNDLREWLATLGIGSNQLRAALDQISFGKVAGIVASLLTGTVTTTMSPAAAASSLVAAEARGPSSATVSASVSGPRELLSTTWWPTAMASRAIVLPMDPLPMNPTVVIFSASLQKSTVPVMRRTDLRWGPCRQLAGR